MCLGLRVHYVCHYSEAKQNETTVSSVFRARKTEKKDARISFM